MYLEVLNIFILLYSLQNHITVQRERMREAYLSPHLVELYGQLVS